MKKEFLITLLVTLIALAPLVTTAEESSETINTEVTIDDLTWLTGRWIGDGFGGTVEEVWNQPLGGSMTGSFKLVSKNEISFYEIMTLTVEDGTPTVRLKHFNADLTGWEEKDEVISFEFISLSENNLHLNGISYQRTHPDSLIITVGSQSAEGDSHLTILRCHRD